MPRFLTDDWFDAIEIVLQEAAPSDGPDTWINVIVRDTNGVAPHANIGMTEEITVGPQASPRRPPSLQERIDHLDVTDLWSRVSALTD